jgi:hypothetical protein
MILHFYPGQNLLVVISIDPKTNKDITQGSYEAWGGPSSIGNDPRMPEEPTWPGNYIIDKAHAYRTPTWQMSRIKWGTPLKDMPKKNDVWYQLKNGNWASVKKDHSISRTDIIKFNRNLYNVMSVPKTWIFNDFGPVTIRWFKDLNDNRTLDGHEVLSGQMFHTTPENEAQHALGLPIKLDHSHGCIHLKPQDRERLFAIGVFKPGTRFVVHKYNEKFN